MNPPAVEVICGDALTELRALPAESVQCVITSPPYFLLRDYGVEGQIGLETSMGEYLARLVAVFDEVKRVLRADGTLWLNMGDGWNAWNGNAGANSGDIGRRQSKARANLPSGFGLQVPELKPKDLIGMPWRLAFALQDAGWVLRCDIIWQKTNPIPEVVRDRPTKAHEYVFLLAKSRRYHYDAEAISEPLADSTVKRLTQARVLEQPGGPKDPGTGNRSHRRVRANLAQKFVKAQRWRGRHQGWEDSARPRRNKRSVWTTSLRPNRMAHFATFPEDLVIPCVLAGCPPGGVVLDPFAGSGTTLAVAYKLGRSAIGIEINPEYVTLIWKRLSTLTAPLALEQEEAS